LGKKCWLLKIYETKKNVKVGTQTLITYATTVIRVPIGNQIEFFFHIVDKDLSCLWSMLNFNFKKRKENLSYEIQIHSVKLGDKERFDKEQIGVKEPFPVTKYQFTS
jgi:hypothetical protein